MTGGAGRILHLGVLEVCTTPDNSPTRLVIETFGPAELRTEQLEQLIDALLEHVGQQRIDADQLNETEFALGEAERQHDEARERIKTLEALVERQRREIEQHKTAGEIADRRVRALETERDEAQQTIDSLEQLVEQYERAEAEA